MTQEQLSITLANLVCCSATMADQISTKLQLGECDDTYKLVILNGLIEMLDKYSLDDEAYNCIDEDQFEDALAKAINICEYCGCLTE